MCNQKLTDSQLNLTQVRIKTRVNEENWQKKQKKNPKCSHEVSLFIALFTVVIIYFCVVKKSCILILVCDNDQQ